MKIYLSEANFDLIKRVLRMMKLTFLLLFVFVSSVFANNASSQASKISLNMKSVSMLEVMQEIENQTNYLFVYNSSEIDEKRSVSISVRDKTLENVLMGIFSNSGIRYEIKGKNIVLIKEKAKPNTATQQGKTVTGKVVDEEGVPLPGVTVTVLGETRGVITDVDGKFEITKIEPSNKLVFSFIGMESEIVDVGSETKFNVTLKDKATELDDVTVVGFGKQKKESVVASITTVKPAELKIPSSNLTTALAGKMSGIIAYQRTGEPGQDNAQFFVRGVTTFGYKKDPLILIDGIELGADDLARLHPDDIESFSILKDATATAIYGARGANGVILVNTKEGVEGKVKVSVRFENSVSSPTQDIEMADPITWIQLWNEAVKTRNPLGTNAYSQSKVAQTIAGTNPYAYPAVNWRNEMLRETTSNQRFNINLNGGGKAVRYYLATSYTSDNGIFKEDPNNNYDNNIKLNRLNVRSNININLTKTTEAVLRVNGAFDDYRGPINGGSQVFDMVQRANPVEFPMFYPASAKPGVQHIMFGNAGEGNHLNPYAEMVKGYKESSTTNVLAQIELKQDLGMITEGLSARVMANTKRYSYFDVTRSTVPHFYNSPFYSPATDNYHLGEPLNKEDAREYLDFTESRPKVSSSFYLQAVIDYNRTFNEKHAVGGLLVMIRENNLSNGAESLQKSLPFRNQGISGRLTYAYNNRYFTEFNFGYNGSERFAKKERYGFFPSVAIGWAVDNESFWSNLKTTVNKFKLKASYGLVGNDAIGDSNDRFFYLSQVNLDAAGATFGEDLNVGIGGVAIDRYENPDIAWETAKKFNAGIELGLFENKVEILADVFFEDRHNILMDRAFIPPTMGLESAVRANVGKTESSGFDMSVNYNHSFKSGLWIQGMGNFTYAVGKFKYYEEPDFSATPWRSRNGQPINQRWGYVAERLFVDDEEVLNSPTQFGEYGAGDVKYRDINNDGIINSNDLVPIGHPTTPEIVYGFGLSTGYKAFDFSIFFQGSARSSFWIDTYKSAPFIDSDDDGNVISSNGLLLAFANDHWSEENQNVYALWPRFSTSLVDNNNVLSTYFMQNGSFIRLKQVEVGFTLPKALTDRVSLKSCRLYMSGRNLLTFSKFKLWDPEMAGNGLGYPIQKVINMGLQVNF